MGTVAHEIAHAAGFYHEHSRPDRDSYITVHLENVKDGYERDFDKLGTRSVKDIEPYDYSSVMHYGPTVCVLSDSWFVLNPMEACFNQILISYAHTSLCPKSPVRLNLAHGGSWDTVRIFSLKSLVEISENTHRSSKSVQMKSIMTFCEQIS